MRNLKKAMALLVVLAMLATSLSVVVAADAPAKTDAQIATAIGMIEGTGSGVTAEYLAKTPTRIQAAYMYLKLKGLKADAMAYKGTDNFADASASPGDEPVMAYLKANPQLGMIGKGNNMYDPAALITAQEYYKVMLEALGYKQGVDFEWDTVKAFAKTKGLSKVADVASFTIDNIASATVEALKTVVKGGAKTLVATLVDAKVLTQAKVDESGLVAAAPAASATPAATAAASATPAPTAAPIKIESINAVNTITTDAIDVKVESGATIKVTFNQAVDNATVTSANFALAKGTLSIATTLTRSDDKKTVSVAPVAAMTVGQEYTLTISKDVKADGTTATLGTATTKKFTIVDTLSLASIKVGGTAVTNYVTANTALSLTFNKSLDGSTVNTGTIKIYNETDKSYVTLVPTFAAGSPTQITVTPTTGEYIVAKTYTLKINGLKALDGTELTGYTKTYGFNTKVTPTNLATAITTVPGSGIAQAYGGTASALYSVTTAGVKTPSALISCSPLKMTLQFGREMDASTIIAANIYIAKADASGNEISGSAVAANVTYDPASYTVTVVPTAAVAEKTDYIGIITNNVKDSNGIPAADGVKTAVFTVADLTSPTVTSTSVDDGHRVAYNEDITINFSEKMEAGSFAIVSEPIPATQTKAEFTTTASVRVYDETLGYTVDASCYPGMALETAYIVDNTTPKLIVKAPTAGWKLNTVYQITLNGYVNGETSMSVTDRIDGAKTHGNMMKGDYTVTFTTIDIQRPVLTAVQANKTTDGPGTTSRSATLSTSTTTYGIQYNAIAGDNARIRLKFDKKMKAVSIYGAGTNKEAFHLWVDLNNDGDFDEVNEKQDIPSKFALQDSNKSIEWTPEGAQLAYFQGKTYEGEMRFVITPSLVLDETSTAMGTSSDADKVYKFVVGEGPTYQDAVYTPASGYGKATKYATTVEPTSDRPIGIAFAETKIDYTTVNGITVTKNTYDGAAVTGAFWQNWACDVYLTTANTLNQVYFKPSSLSANTKYFVNVSSAVKDIYGNPATPYSYYFTTKDTTTPVATITAPATSSATDPFVVDWNTAMAMTLNSVGTPSNTTLGSTVEYPALWTTPADLSKNSGVTNNTYYSLVSTITGAAIPFSAVVTSDTYKQVEIYPDTPYTAGQGVKLTVVASAVAKNLKRSTNDYVSDQGKDTTLSGPTVWKIKTATYTPSTKQLVLVLTRPVDAYDTALLTGTDFTFTGSNYAAANNFLGISVGSDKKTITLALKDDTSGATVIPLSIVPGVSKIALGANFKYNNSAGVATAFSTATTTIN